MSAGLVVVGGSYAALHTVASARDNGYGQPITLVTREPRLPYDRPVLSKSFLTGSTEPERLAMRGEKFWTQHDVTTRLSTTVTSVDARAATVRLADGERLPYDQLVLATGSRPRRLPVPGAELDGVHALRDLDDALLIRERLAAGDVASVVVVGAGFIGLEVASALTAEGRTVTVVESAPQIMGRVLTPTLSTYLQRRHVRAGVRIRLGTSIRRLLPAKGLGGDRVAAVELTDGEVLPAELVLVGIGAFATTSLAELAGARCSPAGVVVDAGMRTSVPGVFAAGDCTLHPNRYAADGGPVRLESVQNAVDQGRVAGANVAGGDAPYDSVPWFWSDQCGVKLQLAGLAGPASREVVRGDPDSDRFSVLHLAADDRVTAVDSVNRPAEHMLARRLVNAGARVTSAEAADPSFDLASTLARPVPQLSS